MSKSSRKYSSIIIQKNAKQISFKRGEIVESAKKLGIKLPKNIGDLIYSFRYRVPLPDSIRKSAPKGLEWIIRPAGQALYTFSLTAFSEIKPSPLMAETKIPDSAPGIIEKYALNDEQALLAKLRYNRLIDIFTGITCYSLQSHLRTNVPKIGQIETDEIYVGLDKRGAHYVFPVQAKGSREKLGIIQIEQDFELCALKFPALICLPIAAQFTGANLIALFSFEKSSQGIAISSENTIVSSLLMK